MLAISVAAGGMTDGATEIVPRQPEGQEPLQAPPPRPLEGLKYAIIGFPRNEVRSFVRHTAAVWSGSLVKLPCRFYMEKEENHRDDMKLSL